MMDKRNILSANDLTVDCYKYVRIGDEFRFCGAMKGGHADMLAAGETAKSAAFLHVFHNYIRISDSSFTLKIGPAEDDGEILAKLLGKTLKTRGW